MKTGVLWAGGTMASMPVSGDMKGMPGMSGPGMHGMYAPPANTHNLLFAWPISVPAVLALGLAAWAGYRAVLLWRRGTPRPLSWVAFAAVAVASGLAGLWWLATAQHSSPFAYAMVVVEVAAGIAYLTGVRRLAGKGRQWPVFRTSMFIGGLVAIALALQSPIATLVATSFTYHVMQHMLLMVVAPPLLALSAPMTLALQTTSRKTKVVLLKVLHSRAFGVITFPVVVWFAYYGVMFAFFLTPLLGYAMNHMMLMDLLNLVFLGGGCLFWWPTVGVDYNPRWTLSYGMRIINLLIGVPFESFLGIALLSGSTSAASIYTVSGTHVGGGLLWTIGEISAFVGTAIVMFQWVKADDRLAAREDRKTAASQRALAQEQATGPVESSTPAPLPSPMSAATAYEEAWLVKGVRAPVILEDDHAV